MRIFTSTTSIERFEESRTSVSTYPSKACTKIIGFRISGASNGCLSEFISHNTIKFAKLSLKWTTVSVPLVIFWVCILRETPYEITLSLVTQCLIPFKFFFGGILTRTILIFVVVWVLCNFYSKLWWIGWLCERWRRVIADQANSIASVNSGTQSNYKYNYIKCSEILDTTQTNKRFSQTDSAQSLSKWF